MCGTKNFSSVRWYSAPQLLHLTIVAISGICAPAHQFSSTDCCRNQTAHSLEMVDCRESWKPAGAIGLWAVMCRSIAASAWARGAESARGRKVDGALSCFEPQ